MTFFIILLFGYELRKNSIFKKLNRLASDNTFTLVTDTNCTILPVTHFSKYDKIYLGTRLTVFFDFEMRLEVIHACTSKALFSVEITTHMRYFAENVRLLVKLFAAFALYTHDSRKPRT